MSAVWLLAVIAILGLSSPLAQASKLCDGLDQQAAAYNSTWNSTFDSWAGGQPTAQNAQFDAWVDPILDGWAPAALSSGCPNVPIYQKLVTFLTRERDEFSQPIVPAGQPDQPVPVPSPTPTLAMPCAKPGDPNPVKGLRTCVAVAADVKTNLESRIMSYATSIYEGCVSGTATDAQVAANTCLPPGAPTARVCDRSADSLDLNQAETGTSNHLGNTCGNWVNLQTTLHGRTCSVTPQSGGPQGYGDREDAYMRGAKIHSLDCYRHNVETELATYSLHLTQVGTTPGPCLALAQTYQAKLQTTSQNLMNSLGAEQNISDIANCAAQGSLTGTAQTVGQNRQSACQLIASRTALEVSFTQIAACEVIYRAQLAHDKFRMNASQGTGFNAMVFEKINADKCTSQSASDCTSATVLQNCYVPKYQSMFDARVKDVWPDGLCLQ